VVQVVEPAAVDPGTTMAVKVVQAVVALMETKVVQVVYPGVTVAVSVVAKGVPAAVDLAMAVQVEVAPTEVMATKVVQAV